MSNFKDIADQAEVEQDKPIPYRQWTAMDMVTHDFCNSQEWREYCLEKFGQYMTDDGIRVKK